MNLIERWNSLEWNLDKGKKWFRIRKKPLTLKELFFRDKVSVLNTVVMIIIWVVIIIITTGK